MERLKFDPQKIEVVNIEKVKPNKWNPKQKNTNEYKKVKESIKKKGLRLPIIVRENEEHYEIIDGEQRYTASKELGYKKVIIYNEGKISDKEAKELTIWYQQQVPFDEIMLAEMIEEMTRMYDIKDLELPFDEKEIEELQQLVKFDWRNIEKNNLNPEDIELPKKNKCPNCGYEW